MRAVKSSNPASQRQVAAQDPAPTILIVGEVSRWIASGRELPRLRGRNFVEFHQFGPETCASLRPDIVLSPLVCPSFDCLDLAAVLHGFGFAGRYRVLAPDLPNPSIICAEVSALFPGLDFDLVFLPSSDRENLN
jgi:hypothetical protein